MEHPQTVLLNKVLQSNISLGNAHVNNLEYSKIVRQWMDLQQSINVLFDSKTATGEYKLMLSSLIGLLISVLFLNMSKFFRFSFDCISNIYNHITLKKNLLIKLKHAMACIYRLTLINDENPVSPFLLPSLTLLKLHV